MRVVCFICLLNINIIPHGGEFWQAGLKISKMSKSLEEFKKCHRHPPLHDQDDRVSNVTILLGEFKKCLGPLNSCAGLDFEEIQWMRTGDYHYCRSSSLSQLRW